MNRHGLDLLDSGRRDKMEIIAAIVATTQNPSLITRVLGQANLSYPLLKKYVKFMLSRRLIERRKIGTNPSARRLVFQATKKGFTFLETYCDILRIIYGEDFLKKDNNLAVYCLKYCQASNLE